MKKKEEKNVQYEKPVLVTHQPLRNLTAAGSPEETEV